MKYEIVENLTQEELSELYFDIIQGSTNEKIMWECGCKTFVSNSNCRCKNTSNETSTSCNQGMTYHWQDAYNGRYLPQACPEMCTSNCGSSACYSYNYTGYGSSYQWAYCARR